MINYFYFSLDNFLVTFLLACNGGICITKTSLAINKRELLKTSLYFF